MSVPSYADLKAWDHAYVWHPFTQMQDWLQEDPIIIASGEGNYVIDVNGRRYLDGVSSLWCNVHGHTHPPPQHRHYRAGQPDIAFDPARTGQYPVHPAGEETG